MPPTKPATPAPVWLPELEPGPHAVGYRQQWFEDPTRSLFDPSTGASTKRPLLLSVWYPSDAAAPDGQGGQGMGVDDYLRVEAPGAGAWRERLARHVRKVRDHEVFDGEPTDALAELATMARRDASWAAGRFALVLAHPGLGGSFSDNFVLWEYLASHGFVVVSGAFLDASGMSSAINWDPATSIADLDRMFEAAAAWPGVDADRSVVIGHSYGGQAALAYALAGRDVLGVVSLDSTIEYANPDEPWYEEPEPARYLGARERLRVPTLVFHSGGQSTYVEGLTRSDRSVVVLPELQHNDFIAHGGVLRAVYTEHADPKVRAGYVEVADTVRRFIARTTSASQAPEPVEPTPDNWTRLPAEPGPPELAEVLGWIRELGPGAAWERCASHEGCAAESQLNAAGYVLLRAGRPALAEQVFATVVERVPESWNAWDSWAEVAAERGERAAATERYGKALELVVELERSRPRSDNAVHRARIERLLNELEAPSG
ncbi:Alpha/beta hydrolase family protein [Enhygromyxa salina]|uniref:Alpha/beta hydrolase family protein n=2 Tax=Enhygromyxa salina TaxID=215803 RepID=A0A2S9YBU5_9BACT|nr:Alpha/beta hydrolase family protein [Enhygromyxa salina]